MRSLFKLSLYGGGVYGTYTFYNNRIRSAPADPKLSEKKQKKIVVVGAGIVGLGTAYYLS
jgi:NADPH-dependent 2,4-dienoyl-CoA reductase/sulfur reductase-like enzyme